VQALMTASHKLAEHMYADKGAEGATADAQADGKKDDGNVVDAEFEEVKK
jgi:molecular chaperone DnaK